MNSIMFLVYLSRSLTLKVMFMTVTSTNLKVNTTNNKILLEQLSKFVYLSQDLLHT